MSLLIKFIAFYATFAMFVGLYASWSGAGEEVQGWVDFQNTLSGTPGQWMPPAPSTPYSGGFAEFSDQYGVTYLSQLRGNYCGDGNGTGPSGPHGLSAATNTKRPQELRTEKPSNLQSWNILSPIEPGAIFNGSRHYSENFAIWTEDIPYEGGGTQSVEFGKGDWVLTTWFRDTGPYANVTSWNIHVGLFQVSSIPTCNVPAGGAGHIMEFTWITGSSGPVYDDSKHITFVRNVTTKVLWHINWNVVFTMSSNGGIWLVIAVESATYPVAPYYIQTSLTLISDPTDSNYSKLEAPNSYGVTTRCTDVGCAMGSFFLTIGRWFVFIIQGILWLILAFFVTIAWLIVVIAQFFGAMFALSFSPMFGPFGIVAAILTTVFLAYLIVFIAQFIRGTTITGVAA